MDLSPEETAEMADGVKAEVRESSPLVVIDLTGEVTTFADEAINAAYAEACRLGGRNILINFEGVDYLNSAGIAIIIGLMADARASERRLHVTGLTPHYRKVFQVMGLSQYAPMHDDEESARRAVATAG